MKIATDKSPIQIRACTSSDIPAMKSLIFTHGPNRWNYLPEEGVHRHLDGVTTGETFGVLAFDSDELVGMATYCDKNPFKKYEPSGALPSESGYVAEVVVANTHAGRGLGALLLSEARDRLLARGKRRIYVDRHEENLPSAGMMRKTGFIEIDNYLDLERRFVGSKKTTVCCFEVNPAVKSVKY